MTIFPPRPPARRAADTRQTCWPTPRQELLLHAALDRGPAAVAAWHAWRVGSGPLDAGSQRLLPLVYRNLSRQGLREPAMDELKGAYRQAWSQNQMLLHHATGVLTTLQEAGMETLILKGAALVAAYYKDLGVRPMQDVDILIPAGQAAAALRLLQARGWTPEFPLPERLIPVLYACGFTGPGGGKIDLHWHALWECCQPGADDDFWASALPTQLGHAPTRALNPADQLLHVCVHGAAWNRVPPVRWVADALLITNAAEPAVDWERLAAQARKRRLILPLRDTLRYLHARWDAPIPAAVLHGLETAPVSRVERLERGARVRGPSLWGGLVLHWALYARLTDGASGRRQLAGFPRYLQRLWGADRLWQVPLYTVAKTAGRLVHRGR